MVKIGIVGLGLIGGSLGLDWSAQGMTVLGVSRRQRTCDLAMSRGAVTTASTDFSILSSADVVFVCTPIGAIAPTVKRLMPHLRETTVMTDVGSVKGSVVREITSLWHNFVGGHPMAGTAEVGIEAALSHLFVDRPYVLTPTAATPPAAVEMVSQLVRSLQANLIHCNPEAHDRAVAWISHLPVMVSASLIQACLAEPEAQVLELAQRLASSGFRDTSRVGGGNPELGMMMAEHNQAALVRSLYAYRQQLDNFIADIEQQDWIALQEKLTRTQKERPKFVE